MKGRIWIKAVFNFLLVFIPIIVATYLVFAYAKKSYWVLDLLNNIDGNQHPINNILLIYILFSYLVVLVGLISYLNGLLRDIFTYTGYNKWVLFINRTCTYLLGIILIVFVLYYSYFVICASGEIPRNNNIFNLHNLVLINRYLSLFIFFVFLITDLLILIAQTIQKNENEETLKSSISEPEKKIINQKIHDNLNHIQLSKDSTWFINIPTFLVTGLTILFIETVHHLDRFKNYIDQTFKFAPEIPNQLEDNFYELFINGLETGVIATCIIISQLIFVVIKTRWEFRHYKRA